MATLTHEFTKRLPNGLPEPAYNDGLARFDAAILSAFDQPATGVPILVETFGGRRIYYFYVHPDTDVPVIVARIAKSFPREKVTGTVAMDKDWSFLAGYSRDFWLDENGDVLAGMQQQGVNLEMAYDITFSFIFASEAEARGFAEQVKAPDFRTEVSPYEKLWQVEVTHHMLPAHDAINDLEVRLSQAAARFGGRADGWGFFGQQVPG